MSSSGVSTNSAPPDAGEVQMGCVEVRDSRTHSSGLNLPDAILPKGERLMSFRIFVLLFLFWTGSYIYATSHIAYFDGYSVYIGSDTQRHIYAGGGRFTNRVACKVVTGNGIAAVFTGITTDSRLVSASGKIAVTTEHSLYDQARVILGSASSPNAAFEKLIAAAEAQVTYMKAVSSTDAIKGHEDDFAIAGLLITFDGPQAYFWMFDVITRAWDEKPFLHIRQTKEILPRDSFIHIGEWTQRAWKPLVRSDTYPGGSIPLVQSFLRRQHEITPNRMGPPYTVLKLTRDSSEFVIGSEICGEH